MTTVDQRVHMAGIMDYFVHKEPLIHYAQERPMDVVRMSERQIHNLLDHGGSIRMDCSEAVTVICKLAGLHDPNGRDYDGSGYTGTLLAHLPHYRNAEEAAIGALVVFGSGSGHHVCMVRRVGKNPLLFSHGQERGPIFIPLSEEAKYQPNPITFLSIKYL